MSEVMHVGIENPVQCRKEILRIAVDAIQTLKDFEIHKKYNKEKAVYRKQFIQLVKELNQTIQEFRALLPILHIPHSKEAEEVKSSTAPMPVIKKPIVKRKKTELDKLEDDISYLKDKIANL